MSKKHKPLASLAAAILFVVLAAGAGVYIVHRAKGLNVTVTFSDARGLVANRPLEYRGIKIGSVTGVRADSGGLVAVELKIDSEHAEHVRENALFAIFREISTDGAPGVILGYCADKDPYENPVLPGGAVVRGEDSEMIFMLKTSIGCFDESRNSLSDAFEDLKKNFDNALNSPNVKKLQKDIEEFFMRLNREARERAKRFLEEDAPEIRKKIEELIKELQRLGREKEAEEWKEFLDEKFQKEV